MSVAVRRATRADSSSIADLSGVLGYPVEHGVMSERLAAVLAREDHAVFVAVDRDATVGWIHGAERHLLEIGSECEIAGLVVDASVRRSGAGRALVAAVEQWAVTRRLQQVSGSQQHRPRRVASVL